jgi:hypothetical protein
METSILTSIKKMLGIAEEYIHFDSDIITHINSVIFRLKTLGVGPTPNLVIEDKLSVWDDLLDGNIDIEIVKTYMYLSVKLIFDPPQTSFVIDSIKKQISEYEWFIAEQADGNLEE